LRSLEEQHESNICCRPIAPDERLTGVFRQGLAEVGYVEGRNVVIDYRNADNRYERLPGLVTELVMRPVAVIVAITTPPALAAKNVGTTVPLVFMVADDLNGRD
jgi:putative ABC transport system substrate-binding protein